MSFISFTENSQENIKKFMQEGELSSDSTYLRVAINGYSCSGPKFSLYFDDNYNSDFDEVSNFSGFKVVTNKSNLEALSGYTIDYQKNETTAGFVFNNPLKSLGCSSNNGCCGGNRNCND